MHPASDRLKKVSNAMISPRKEARAFLCPQAGADCQHPLLMLAFIASKVDNDS